MGDVDPAAAESTADAAERFADQLREEVARLLDVADPPAPRSQVQDRRLTEQQLTPDTVEFALPSTETRPPMPPSPGEDRGRRGIPPIPTPTVLELRRRSTVNRRRRTR